MGILQRSQRIPRQTNYTIFCATIPSIRKFGQPDERSATKIVVPCRYTHQNKFRVIKEINRTKYTRQSLTYWE